jgi:23S rRNA pseudouridine1911/1915/1917 synthase
MRLQAGPDERGVRLDVFLAGQLENLTRSQIQSLNRAGAIHVDGQQEKAGYKIRGGEAIEVNLNSVAMSNLGPALLKPEHIPLQIHYEDGHLAVIEKPAGLVVHPGAGARTGTVAHALLFHFQNLSSEGGDMRPGIVHRLDKWTSGLLLVAKNNSTHAKLGRAFQDRQIQKDYLALVHGRPSKASATIELPIGRHSTIRTRMAARAGRGRSAHTEYRIVREFNGFSLLEVKIRTGRTHQIRVHLSAIGHPVVGDDVYGERQHRQFVKKYGALGRYFLHAAGLRLKHPVTGAPIEFHSPLPPELNKFLERIDL